MRLIITTSKKDQQKHSHYLQINSEKNKSQNRPKRTNRKQILLFNTMMHDFSKWSDLIVLQPEQKNITKTFFSKIILTSKKRFRCCLLTIVKKMDKKMVTDVSYIPRTEFF